MSFTIRKFDHHQHLCDKLRALRKEANFTLSQMAEKTKINKTCLRQLESGAYDKLPNPIYSRNFLKIYLRTLGVEETYYLDLYETECGTCDFITQARLPRQRTRALQFLVPSRLLKTGLFLLIAMSILFYLGSQIRTIITPPDLAVLEPTDGFMTRDATILVSGSAEADASVRVNGQAVLLTKTATFEIEVALERGLNLIKIESVKRYSRPAVEYRRVVLEQDRSITFLSTVDK